MLRLIFIGFFILGFSGCAGAVTPERLKSLSLPKGFAIEIYAKVPGARSMVIAPEIGVVFVGTRGNSVYAIQDRGLKGQPEKISLLYDTLKVPNGVAWQDGQLYIAEQHRIISLRLNNDLTTKNREARVLVPNLPDDAWHGWRYAAFNKEDGRLYVAIGAPCNVCRLKGLEGTIIRVHPWTGEYEVYAKGVRNSVGLTFHPHWGDLYFTDNGSDGLGDDIPPDELNHAREPGLHYGYPWYGGGDTPTGEFDEKKPPMVNELPLHNFQAHTASLGLTFYDGVQFPKEYRGDLFIAQHGSWNRSTPIGYRLVRLKMDEDGKKVKGKEIFAQGWLRDNGGKWGRPVDVKQFPDGSLLVSDDYAGVIYRIKYVGKK